MARNLLYSFVEKVSVQDGPDGCWVWKGATGSDGYGRLRRGSITHSAHRYSYELFKGPIPEGLCVMHQCDTPQCVNPRHLVLGTKADNSRDMLRKGRQGQTAKKLEFAEVLEVRRMLADGATKGAISAKFGICRSTVQDIEAGATWPEPADDTFQGYLF